MCCMKVQYSVLQAKLSTLSIVALWESQKVGKSESWESEFDFPESATVCQISPSKICSRATLPIFKKKNGSHIGNFALIPRIDLLPFRIKRRQFPRRLC